MAFILSRTVLAVASPEMIGDPNLDLDEASYGDIAAWGMGGMIAGKLLTGAMADWLGGRRVFLIALALTALLSATFGWASSTATFAAINFFMLFAMAASWPSMASIISVWFSPTKYGRVWSALSTSSRLSAALSLIVLGSLLSVLSWQNVFRTAGLMSLCVLGLVFFYLKASPEVVGLPERDESPAEPERDEADAPLPTHFLDDKNPAEALRTFATSGRFWLLCASVMCTTVLMDFLIFLPLYLASFEGVSSAQASSWASAFPIGCLLALVAGGFVYDRVSRKGRIALLGGLLAATTLCVAALWGLSRATRIPDSLEFTIAIVVLFFYGFSLAPAYYLPPSVFSNEFGGKHCGLLVGIVDAAAYCGSMLYLVAGGRMVVTWGWQSVIELFLVIATVATLITAWFAFEDYKRFPTNLRERSAS